ncbi:hypothetical protein GGX14DRAFT_373358, partial [Mycena pura]
PARWPGSTPESTATARKYLQQDYEDHHGFFNYTGAHNHTPFHILVEWSLGGNSEHLDAIWNQHDALERPAHRSPGLVNASNFYDHLGDEEYYQGYLHFFSDILVKRPIRDVVEEWVFSGKANFDGRQPEMVNRLLAGILHPLIYLGYGIEFSLPGLVAEGLAQAAVHKIASSLLIPKSIFSNMGRSKKHSFTIIARIMRDNKFANFKSFDVVQTQVGMDIQRMAADWTVDGSNPKEVARKMEELCFLNVMIFTLGGWRDGQGFHDADFTRMHLVTSSMTLSSYMAVLSPTSKSLLLRAYFTRSLAFYVASGRPNLPVRSFFKTPLLTSFPGPKPSPTVSVYPSSDTPNLWLKIIQSAIVHPDDHLSKFQRTLAHYSTLYGNAPAGTFEGTELDGCELIDGTFFLRVAALTMEWMGRIREGEPARFWANDPNYPDSVVPP